VRPFSGNIYGRANARSYLILLIIPACLLFFRLDILSMWGDELYTLDLIHRPIREIITIIGKDYHPPLYFLVAKAWCGIFGFTDIGLRSLSSFLGILGIFVSFRFYKDYLNRKEFLYAILLIFIHPVALLYFRMGRYYSALYLLAVLSLYFYFKMTLSFRRGYYIPYIISSIFLLYTSNTGWFVLASEFILFLIFTPKMRSNIFRYLASQLIIIVAFSPWLSVLIEQISNSTYSPPFHSSLGILGDTGLKIIYPLYSFFLSETVYPWDILFVLPVFLFIVAAIYGLRKLWKDRSVLIGLIGILTPLLLMTAVSLFIFKRLPFAFFPSRIIYSLLFVPMLLSIGLTKFKVPLGLVGLVVLLIFYGYADVNYFLVRDYHNLTYSSPLKEAAEDFKRNAPGAEIIITDVYSPSYYFGNRVKFLDLHQFQKEYTGPLYPNSLWFLIKDPSQKSFAIEVKNFIDDLSRKYHYEKDYEKGYGKIDDFYRRSLSKILGREINPYNLTIIHLKSCLP